MYSIDKDTGVAIIFFNRPECVSKVFESVRKAQPPKLFLIQDGARGDRDVEKVEACRKIVENVDWECEIFKNYSNENLGCGKRMSSGITWVFEHVEKAMILEDDCVPNESFYRFCDETLEKYKDDKRILMISGMNHWGEWNCQADYLFAYSGSIWGWATWKRAWDKFDFSVAAINDSEVQKMLMSGIEPRHVAKNDILKWKETNVKVMSNQKISYWAHQWRLVKFLYHNLCIIPKVNLISNVGDVDATHPSNGEACEYHHLATKSLNFPLKHPDYIFQDFSYDDKYYEVFEPTRAYRIKKRIGSIFAHGKRK